MTNPNAPILSSRYMANAPNCSFTWTGEIVAAAVDGSNTVWRFAHNHNGGCYYGEGFAQISNDGNWALLSSYWDGTLGPDTSFGCQTRIDTFIVQLSGGSPPPPPTQGLIGYWNFDEGSGTVAHDSSGSGYNGTVNGATWTTGKINSALNFNGTTNGVVTPGIALANAFSITAWVNPAVTNQTTFARIAETQYNGGFYLGADVSGNTYKFIVNAGTGSTGVCGASFGCAQGGTITSGWHLVTGTFDGTTAILYVDNVRVGSDTFTAPGNTNYPLYIGRYYGGTGYGWNAGIDEVRLYNRALTSAEVTTIFNYQ